MPPPSLSTNNPRNKQEVRVVRLAYSSTLKIDGVRSSETSVNIYQTTRHHILEDSGLHIYRSENLKSNGYVW
jgi:hypothetical protein